MGNELLSNDKNAQVQPNENPLASAKAPTMLSLSEEQAGTIVTQAGGIFIGRDELVALKEISPTREVPPLPEKLTKAFLESQHPLRPDGTIAKHVILALDFDRSSGRMSWNIIDRGKGGASDLIPGSLGPDGEGLTGAQQDKLIAGIVVEGIKLVPGNNIERLARIMTNACSLHVEAGKPIKEAPFAEVFARTGDSIEPQPGVEIRSELALSPAYGYTRVFSSAKNCHHTTGSIGMWV